ncbi:hypothetical protein GCM10009037_28240 [Halarchaeum grantii]|uniref:Transporter n=1 Tax=Halarchaeum grantii TaxID=1193105 RepID=A0A830EYQ7_9EURY|nr:transporter [Halarchaeum grantii]GGL43124.1 hypothetical protein GCM10009037_28240 [Halarchaeum grantii]
MATALTAVYAIHLLAGALWAGSVCFFTYSYLPLAKGGDVSVDVLASATSKLTTVSRAGAVLQLLTGGYLASPMGVGTTSAYWSSTSGYLVIAMVVLWLLLAAFTEMAASRLRDGLDVDKVRTPAREASALLYAASAVAVLLLVDAGLLLA